MTDFNMRNYIKLQESSIEQFTFERSITREHISYKYELKKIEGKLFKFFYFSNKDVGKAHKILNQKTKEISKLGQSKKRKLVQLFIRVTIVVLVSIIGSLIGSLLFK